MADVYPLASPCLTDDRSMDSIFDDVDTPLSTKVGPARPRVHKLPPWRVLLHNDDQNVMGYVVNTIRELTSLTYVEAVQRMAEAHQEGVALLLVTHQEHAELLAEQFASKSLFVSIEKGP